MNTILKETHKTKIELLDGEKYVRKTIKGSFSKIICGREYNALKKLQGIKGIQKLIERDSENSIITEYIKGKTIKEFSCINIDVFNKVEYILKSMNERGVADFDFGNKNDWLIDDKGNIVLVDFAASVFLDDIIGKKLVNFGIDLSYTSLYKYKAKVIGYDNLTKKEKEFLEYYKGILSLNKEFKVIKKKIRKIF